MKAHIQISVYFLESIPKNRLYLSLSPYTALQALRVTLLKKLLIWILTDINFKKYEETTLAYNQINII